MLLSPEILLLCVALLQTDEGALGGANLAHILRGMYSDLQDVEFVYEGHIKYVGDSTDPEHTRFDKTFQGIFAFRSDGSAHDDSYRHDRVGVFSRNVQSRLGGIGTHQSQMPQRGEVPLEPESQPRSLEALIKPMSPMRIYFIPRLVYSNVHEVDTEFSDLGWELVGDRRCRKVRYRYKDHPNNPTWIYWLDMDRGGNPIKHEYYVYGHLAMSCDDIRLDRVASKDGRWFWLPVEGRCNSYLQGPKPDDFADTPRTEEYYSIVEGTVLINQGLPDRRFGPDWTTVPKTELLASTIRAFRDQPPRKLDTASVERDLEELLKVADQQSEQLVASQGLDAGIMGRIFSLRSALMVVGIVLLAYGGLRMRSRASSRG